MKMQKTKILEEYYKCIVCEKPLNGLDHHDGICFDCMDNNLTNKD